MINFIIKIHVRTLKGKKNQLALKEMFVKFDLPSDSVKVQSYCPLLLVNKKVN